MFLGTPADLQSTCKPTSRMDLCLCWKAAQEGAAAWSIIASTLHCDIPHAQNCHRVGAHLGQCRQQIPTDLTNSLIDMIDCL